MTKAGPLHKTIQQIPAFRHFNESECHQLAEVALERSFAPGEAILEQGKKSQDLWIVLEGKLQVVRDNQHDGRVVLADFEPFNLFGEMSFFSPAPHSATVLAQTPVKLLCIPRVEYDDMIRDGVLAAYKLAYHVVESVVAKLRVMDERISQTVDLADAAAKQPEKPPEWRQFREKLFNGWNL